MRIDLRIANRELKTSQTVAEQLRDAEKAADQKLREKDEQLTTNQTLLEQVPAIENLCKSFENSLEIAGKSNFSVNMKRNSFHYS